MPILDRIRTWVLLVVAIAGSACFAASFGFNYGVNNQVVYLLGSLRLVNPGILEQDWFATQTTHYHPAFKYLGALLLLLDRRGWAVGVGLTVAVTVGMMLVYLMFKALMDRGLALPGFLLLLAIAFDTRTGSVGASYVFDTVLQPSTLASVALLASILFFAQGRWLASGIALGVSGLFHVNYLVLSFGFFVPAHILLGRQEFRRRLVRQLAAPAAVLLLFSPMILATAGGKEAREAMEIYVNVRAPHHFAVSTFKRDLVRFAAWQLLGFGAAFGLVGGRGSVGARLATLVAALVTLIWGGVGLSALQVRQATQLFAWRLCPHAELLLQVLFCVAVARIVQSPERLKRYPLATIGSMLAGLVLLSIYEGPNRDETLPILLFASSALVVVAAAGALLVQRFAAARRAGALRRRWERGSPWLLAALGLLAACHAGKPHVDALRKHSTLLSDAHRADQNLYGWMRSQTRVDARFLTPPVVESMRYHGQRAIVVDWKSNPVLPGEVNEWHRRLEDVCGRRVRGMRDLEGYAELDRPRLDRLRESYRLDYAVVRRGREKGLGYRVVYENDAWVVLDLGAPR